MNEASGAVRATGAVCPGGAAEAWVLAPLSPELEPRPLDAAVEVACFWGERLLEVRCLGEGERLAEDGVAVALRGGRATVESPVSARAGATTLVERGGPLVLARGERAVVSAGSLAWGVRFVRAPRPLLPEPLPPAEVRFFKYTAMALLALIAGVALSLIAEDGFGGGRALFSPRMIRSVVQGATRPTLSATASRTALKLRRQQAPSGPSTPAKTPAPPRGVPDKKAAVKAMMANLFGGDSVSNVFGPSGLDAAVDAQLNALSGNHVGVAAEGLGGLGARGTGSGSGDRLLGVGGVGTVGGGPGGSRHGLELGAGGHAPVRVLPGPVTVTDGLDRDVIRRVIHRHESEVKFCYESALSRNATLGGKVMVSFVIGPAGAVTSAAVGESTVGDDAFSACLVGRVRTWTFPAPAGGGEVEVNYPWVVKVAGSEE